VQHGVDLGHRPTQRLAIGKIDDVTLEPALVADGAEPRGIAAGKQRPQAHGLGSARNNFPYSPSRHKS